LIPMLFVAVEKVRGGAAKHAPKPVTPGPALAGGHGGDH
jgi:hypothetical protein